jgi:phosphate:Na+ symporter
MTSTDFWKLLAGLGMFLYGMFHLEDTMKQLEGRSFKLFLQKHTKKKLSAILSGTFVTAVLQSSSIVNLMVLSFVGSRNVIHAQCVKCGPWRQYWRHL